VKKHYDIEDIRRENRAAGYHFFDQDALRFFASRIGARVWQGPGGVYFVSSERFISRWGSANGKRYFTCRVFHPETGNVDTLGPFNKLSRYRAERLASLASELGPQVALLKVLGAPGTTEHVQPSPGDSSHAQA
jgi:hypothetical protein